MMKRKLMIKNLKEKRDQTKKPEQNKIKRTKRIMIATIMISILLITISMSGCQENNNKLKVVKIDDKEQAKNEIKINILPHNNTKTENKTATEENNEEELKNKNPEELLKKILSDGEKGAYKIKYSVSTNQLEGVKYDYITIYYKEGYFRTDSAMTMNDQPIKGTMIFTPEYMITCNYEGSWNCMKIGKEAMAGDAEDMANAMNPTAEQSPDTNPETLKEELASGNLKFSEEKRIAGVNTYCFLMNDEKMNVKTEVCYSSTGAPLYIYSETPNGYFKEEATEYTTTVTDQDFEPPATPTDLSTFASISG